MRRAQALAVAACALLAVSVAIPGALAQDATPAAGCPACPSCPACECAAEKKAIAAKDGTIAGLEAKVASLSAELAEMTAGKKDLEAKLGEAAAAVRALEVEAGANKDALKVCRETSEEAAAKEEICLPPNVSGPVLKAWTVAKPMLVDLLAFLRSLMEMVKPMLAQLKTFVVEGWTLAYEKVAELLGPYVGPAWDKVDEVTKPIQPHLIKAYAAAEELAMKAYAVAKPLAMKLAADAVPLYEDLSARWHALSSLVAREAVAAMRKVPNLEPHVRGDMTEQAIMNTLVVVPLLTLGYAVFSTLFCRGRKKKGKKGKGQPKSSSPGRPAFKPDPKTPFKPSPLSLKQRGKKK